MLTAFRSRVLDSGDVGNLIRSAGTFVSTLVVQAAGGFAFWIIAAHRSTPEVVGLVAALASSTLFILYASNLGLNLAVGRFSMHDTIVDRQLFFLAGLVTASSSVVATLIYVAIFSDQPALEGSYATATLTILTVLTALGTLVDVRLLALRERHLVLARGAVCGIARAVGVLVAPLEVVANPIWMLCILNGPDALTGLGASVYLSRGAARPTFARRWPAQLRAAARFAWVSNFSQLALLAPIMGLPIVVLLIVTPAENGSFYVVWNVAAAVTMIPMATLWSLHLEGGRDGARLDHQVRFALLVSGGVTAAITVLSVPASLLVPVVYGQNFVSAGQILPFLILGTVPWSITVVLLSEARVSDHSGLAFAVSFTNAAACLGLGVVLTRAHGIEGAAAAWVIGNTAAALVGASGRMWVRRRSAALGGDRPLVGVTSPSPAVALEDAAPDGPGR